MTNAIAPETWRLLRPPRRVSTWDWILSSMAARPTANASTAITCPGVAAFVDAFDDPAVRVIALQWAARLGKTLISQSILLRVAATDPQQMLLGVPTETLLKRMVRRKLYPMADAMPPLQAENSRSEARRAQHFLDFHGGMIQGAWSGSETMLADYSAAVTHADEVDKWDANGGAEGDPLDQFHKRSHEFPDRKNLVTSTPQYRHRSRIETARLKGNDCRFWVPCPACKRFQTLTFGRGDRDAAGIVWERDDRGRHDPDRAYQTARYLCAHCRAEIADHHRPAMMRGGVWAPRDCYVERGNVIGPQRPSRTWSSQLSTLYSLNVRWGNIAEWWVSGYKRTASRRAFVQLTEGLTFEHEVSSAQPEDLAKRLADDTPRGEAPEWARLLVFVSDVQADTFPWMLLAIGPNERTHLVDWGHAYDWDEIGRLIDAGIPHGDGGKIAPALALLDSGHRTKEVYRFTFTHHKPQRPVWAVKGSSGDLAGQLYQRVQLGRGKSRARREASKAFKGANLIHVNTDHWETVVQSALCDLTPGDPGYLTLCGEAAASQSLLAELLNATLDDVTNRRGEEVTLWIKANPEEANDLRDCLKYGLCGALVYTDLRDGRLPNRPRQAAAKPQKKPAPAFRPPGPIDPRPAGWLG